jgi:hypothetical protein
MALALNKNFNQPLRTLISADMAPSIGKISPEYVFDYFTDMIVRMAVLHRRS